MSLDLYLRFTIDTGAEPHEVTVFDQNITHNVHAMWHRAGVNEALYESDGRLAGEFLESLKAGVVKMEGDREGFEALNPSNGWGDYEGALSFLREVRDAFVKFPKAIIGVSR